MPGEKSRLSIARLEAEAVAEKLDDVVDPRAYVRFGGRARPISDQTYAPDQKAALNALVRDCKELRTRQMETALQRLTEARRVDQSIKKLRRECRRYPPLEPYQGATWQQLCRQKPRTSADPSHHVYPSDRRAFLLACERNVKASMLEAVPRPPPSPPSVPEDLAARPAPC